MSRLLGLSRRELTVLTAVFVLTLPAVTPRIYASDEIQYFSYLRSLWFDHDVSFENEYRHFYDHDIGRGENFHATFLQLETDSGRRPNFGTIGSAILWAPFYAVADIVARLTDANADGYSQPYVAAVAYGSAFYGFAAVVLAAAMARMVLGPAAPKAGRRSAQSLTGRESSKIHVDLTGRESAHIHADLTGRESARIQGDPLGRDASRIRASQPGHTEPASAPQRNRIGFEVIAAILVWIGTPLLFYMYIAPPYAHACSALAVALFLFVWLRVRRTWSVHGAIALGLCAALMAMVREQDVFFAVGPAVDFLISALRGVRLNPGAADGAVLRYAKTAVAGCVAFGVGYLPQLLAYNALNGYPGPSRLVVRKMLWHSPHALQVLGSPEHGFLLWTPLAIVAIAGLAALAWRGADDTRRIGYLLLLMLALQVYVSGSVDSWTVAGAFGQRRFVAVTSLLTVGMALVLRDVPKGAPRVAIGVLVALCVWWNLALAAAFGTGLMNRQRLELARNAYDAFVTVPRMAPDLAIRYVTKRDSFYRQRE